MKTASISEAARILGRHRPAVYRLIESGAIRCLPGCRIPVADLDKIPKQKRKLREVCFARIRRADLDPRRILYILSIAAQSADADTLIHAGRFLLEGNKNFLRTLEAENPPMVEHRAPDGEGAPFVGMDFPTFIAGRIRLYANKPERIPLEAKAPVLWKIFWPAALGRPFKTFPLFRSGWIRLAPDWQNDATIYCPEQETVLSFASPVYRPTPAETNAARYMEKHFPESKVWDLYGLDNITPAALLIVKAIISARMEADEDPQTAVELLGELGVPASIALDLARLARRILGKQSKKQAGLNPANLQSAGPDPSGKSRILIGKDSRGAFSQQDYLPADLIHLPMNRSAVAKALGISRPTLYAWT